MLNRRDRELAREIARQIRYPPTRASTPSAGVDGLAAFLIHLFFIPMTAYTYIEWYWIFSIPTGFVLFVTPAMHASWRFNYEEYRVAHYFFLILYVLLFLIYFKILLSDGHIILSYICVLFGILTSGYLLRAIFGKSPTQALLDSLKKDNSGT